MINDSNQQVRGTVDIVVLIDVSGSMQACIDAVKKSVSSFINFMTTADANNSSPIEDWRMKVVGYRDYERTDHEWFVDAPFARDVASIETQLAAPSMQAIGGGDEPESLLDALFKIASMGEAGIQDGEDANLWRPRGKAARAVVFFTDATFKLEMSLPEAKGGQIQEVINRLLAAKVILCGLHPEWSGYESLGSQEKAKLTTIASTADFPAIAGLGSKVKAEADAAQKAAVEALRAKVNNTDIFIKILEQLARTLSKSVHVEKA